MKKKRDLEGNRLYHFELSDKNRTVRWILVVVLLVVAAVAITVGVLSALRTPGGWQTVTASSTKMNCSEEFVLQYEYGAGEMSASAESKALELLYGKTVEDAWNLFYTEAGSSDLAGIYQLNQHLNEPVTIDSSLYQALEQIEVSGSRALYLAPVYAQYDRVFYSENATIALECDPGQNPDQRKHVQTLTDYANDPHAIQLVLNGGNSVTLTVSEEYLSFAQENEVEFLVDFGWLRNAFVADYIASVLTENGFTNGFIASVDGFTRNLDQRGTPYSLNLFHKEEDGIDRAAVMEYTSPMSLVYLRSYPMHELDSRRYYTFENGRIVTAMVSPSDGQSKVATDTLVSYSDDLTCGELVLAVMPVFVTEELSEEALNALLEKEIYSVWFDGKQLKYNQTGFEVTITDRDYTK